MVNEIIAGLKNAIERGSSLEDAVDSFVNAGYNPEEVRNAAKMIKTGATSIALGSEDETEKLEPQRVKFSKTTTLPTPDWSEEIPLGKPVDGAKAPKRDQVIVQPKSKGEDTDVSNKLPPLPKVQGKSRRNGARALLIVLLIIVLAAILGGIGYFVYTFLNSA